MVLPRPRLIGVDICFHRFEDCSRRCLSELHASMRMEGDDARLRILSIAPGLAVMVTYCGCQSSAGDKDGFAILG